MVILISGIELGARCRPIINLELITMTDVPSSPFSRFANRLSRRINVGTGLTVD